MAVRVWSEHLADIARAVKIIEQAEADLNTAAPEGQPGNFSDLEFVFPRRIPIEIYGTDSGWAIVYDEELETWVAEFGEEPGDGDTEA